MYVVNILGSHQGRETTGALDNQAIVEHLDEYVHIAQSVGSVDACIDNGLVPGGLRILRRGVELAVFSHPTEIAQLGLDYFFCLNDQSRNRPFHRNVLHSIETLPRTLVLAVEAKKPYLAPRKFGERVLCE